jgi:hypothetical protein
MENGRKRILISSLLLTLSTLAALPSSLRLIGTWGEERIEVFSGYYVRNSLAPMGFASLALICIVLIVAWTGFRNRLRSAWFVLFAFASLFYFPVLIGSSPFRRDWTYVFEHLATNIRHSNVARDLIFHHLGFLLLCVALLLPLEDFFWNRGVNSKDPVARERHR